MTAIAGQDRDRLGRRPGTGRTRYRCCGRDGSGTGRRGRRPHRGRDRSRTIALRHLVGRDAGDGRRRRAPAHWQRPAANERVATETGHPAVRGRPDADVRDRGRARFSLAPPGACSSMHSVAYGIASSRSSPIGLPQRAQVPNVPVVDRPQGGVDLLEHVRRVLLERVVELAVDASPSPCPRCRSRASPRPSTRRSPRGGTRSRR